MFLQSYLFFQEVRGPSSLRYVMISPNDKFAFLKDMVGNQPAFSKKKVAEMERPVRSIIPLKVSLCQRWHVVQHKKFPQRMSKT